VESLFFDANPSLRQLTDNATRSSDQIQRAQQKEGKKVKAHKMTPVDSADLSTEADLMGDDMMGDMDPDQFRGRRSPSFFQKDGSSRDEGQKKGPEKEEKAPAVEPVESFGKDVQRPVQATSGEVVVPEAGQMPSREVRQDSGAGLQEKTDRPDEGKAETPGAPSRGDGLKSKPAILKSRSETVEISRSPGKSSSAADDSSGPAKKQGAGKESAKEPPRRSSSHTSLLSWDDEFIIADPQKKDIVEEDEQGEAPSFESIDLPSDESEEEIKISKLLDDMMAAPVSEETGLKLCELLTPFGGRVMKLFHEFGSKILVLPRGQNLSQFVPPSFFQSSTDTCRDAYIPELKLCVFAEESIFGGGMTFCAPRFYYAVAFDNALGKDDFASMKSAAVLSNYKSCTEGEPGHQFADRFSSMSPVHYFAQAVESYLNEERSGSSLCCREDLYDNDRSMFLYIEYLFRELNREYGSRSLQ